MRFQSPPLLGLSLLGLQAYSQAQINQFSFYLYIFFLKSAGRNSDVKIQGKNPGTFSMKLLPNRRYSRKAQFNSGETFCIDQYLVIITKQLINNAESSRKFGLFACLIKNMTRELWPAPEYYWLSNTLFQTLSNNKHQVFCNIQVKQMSEDESFLQPSRKYKKISYELRMKLIRMVESGQYTYFQAGKKLGLSPSTSKMIVLKFKNEGKVFQKKKDRLKEKKTQQEPTKQEEIVKNNESEVAAPTPQIQTMPYMPYIVAPIYYPFMFPNVNFYSE